MPQYQGAESLRRMPPGEEDASRPAAGPAGAARGILLALLLSAPVWFGIGLGIWALTRP